MGVLIYKQTKFFLDVCNTKEIYGKNCSGKQLEMSKPR